VIETHTWITSCIYPLVNGLAAILWYFAYKKKPLFSGFIFLACSSGLSFFISLLWLILRVQQEFGLKLITSSISRALWAVQAVAEYCSIALFVVGIIFVVKELKAPPSNGAN